MIQTELTVQFEAVADLATFTKRSGHRNPGRMINEAFAYYRGSLTPGIRIIAVDEKTNQYEELFGNIHRAGLRTAEHKLHLKNSQVIHAIKNQSGEKTIGKLLTRVFALYDDILTARESGLTIGTLTPAGDGWKPIGIVAVNTVANDDSSAPQPP